MSKNKFKDNYCEYLSSNEWQKKRKHIAIMRKYCCEMCGKKVVKGFHIHHLSYKNFGHEFDDELMFLCNDCHMKIHHREQNNIRDVVISTDIILSNEFTSLPYSTQMMYIYLKAWAGEKKKFYYSYSLGLKFVSSKSTFKKAIDELVASGFIKVEKSNGKNLFTLLK